MDIVSYEDYQMNPKTVANLNRSYAERMIRQHLERYGVLPDEDKIRSFVIPSELMEKYKQSEYSSYVYKSVFPESNSDKDDDKYDEFVRLKYFVSTTSEETTLFYSSASTDGIGYMEIDGESITPVEKYQFDTIGLHNVDVLLKDSSTLAPLRFTDTPSLREIVIPESVDSLRNSIFSNCKGITKITCLNTVPPSVDTIDNGRAKLDFQGINQNGILWVPFGCKQIYDGPHWFVSGSSYYTLCQAKWEINELPQNE